MLRWMCRVTWLGKRRDERTSGTTKVGEITKKVKERRRDKVTYADVLSRAGLPSMHNLRRKRRLLLLGHVRRMEDGRIPKVIVYGELVALTCDIKMSA